MSAGLGYGVPSYMVKHYSERVGEGVVDDIYICINGMKEAEQIAHFYRSHE
jgi:hypothetical protein